MNDLSELDLSKCTQLVNVLCSRNPKLASLDISNNKTLRSVDCGKVSGEPPIILYVWWEVDENNIWANRPKDLDITIGVTGTIRTKK